MAVHTVQDAFIEFERERVRVPPWQNDQAKKVHPEVRAAVEDALGDLFARAYLAGSYRRRVQTVRLNDVDIIIVLNDPDGLFAASAEAALDALAAAAGSCRLVTGSKKGVRAVKLDIDGVEFTVDLVAALDNAAGEVYLARFIPDEGHDDWTPARPEAQVEASSKKNDATNGVLVPSVRDVKFWNQRLGDGDKNLLPSYLVESIMFHALEHECDFAEASTRFFRAAQGHLSTSTPSVTCPGDPSNYVDERLEPERRLSALAEVRDALVHVDAAEAATEVADELNEWAEIFGPAFPAPSGDTSSLAAALRNGSAVARGAGIAAGGEGGREIISSRPWRPS